MHHTIEKGTRMSKASHTVRSLLHRIGVAGPARLRAFGGSGASPFGPRRLGLASVALAAVATVLVVALSAGTGVTAGASAALTCEVPQFRGLENEEVFATRAHIEESALEGNAEPAPVVKWQTAYSTAADGPWTPAGEGTVAADHFYVWLGALDATAKPVLHNLKPVTKYYARFQAENECSEKEGVVAEAKVEFTTTAIAKPEIPVTFSGPPTFRVKATSPRSAEAEAQVESNGAQTEYHFEYATSAAGPWAPFTSGASGTVTVAEDFADPKAELTGLTPETTYYVRLVASNEVGETVQQKYLGSGGYELESFTTPSGRPVTFTPSVRNITGVSAYVQGGVIPRGLETSYDFEYTTEPKNLAAWRSFAGGTIQAGVPEGAEEEVAARFTGLSPATTYYVRLCATNAEGESVNGAGEVCSTGTHDIESFETAGPPTATALATHGLHGESLRLLGDVDPDSVPTSAEQTITVEGGPTGGTFTLTFEGQKTAPIAYDATADSVDHALGALSTIGGQGEIGVTGRAGGPYTVYFGSEGELKFTGKAVPAMTADGAELQPSPSTVAVVTTQAGGVGYDTHYHFEYVSQKQLESEGGFAKASATPEVDAGSGNTVKFAGEDLPGLQAGETYHYRLVATNTSPGNPVVDSGEQTLTVPVVPVSGPEAACPNESLRTGPSANLPDCRAYEQVTPVDKEGSKELFHYEGLNVPAVARVGEDGDHLTVEASAVSWGSGPTAGQSPYFFSRTPVGWQMTAASAQPEAGVDTYTPQVFSPDLTQLGFESGFATSSGSGGVSKNVEFRAGPPGGPYVTVASMPKAQAGSNGGWVAASADFSKLILQVEDHKLLGSSTGTLSGSDLYEYSGGALRQVNVGIGKCGANIVSGDEEDGANGQDARGSSHAVSSDGSRVFFEAVPGTECSQAKHLYVRVNGGSPDAETIDLGAYRFVAANSGGTEVLLEKASGVNPGLYLDRAGLASPEFLASTAGLVGAHLAVSEDLEAIYVESGEQLTPEAPARSPENGTGGVSDVENAYRYDVSSETLSFVAQMEHDEFVSHISPNGRYYYFYSSRVGGLPGGAVVPGGGQEYEHKLLGSGVTGQIYRYDSGERAIECVSCASSFDPEPKLSATFGDGTSGQAAAPAGTPRLTLVSGNGDFAFFQSTAALVPSDVDGEVIPEGTAGGGSTAPEHASTWNSVSGDVYEWRRDGVDGCTHLQGCLALITNGRGGYLNLLIGSAEEGRDVFIYTSSQLVPQDDDTAGDIYDVRIGGGFPGPAPRPTECEASACSTPASAPNDPTPSSFSFFGAGNLVPAITPAPSTTKPKPKGKVKAKKKKKTGKKRGRSKQKARGSGRDRKAGR